MFSSKVFTFAFVVSSVMVANAGVIPRDGGQSVTTTMATTAPTTSSPTSTTPATTSTVSMSPTTTSTMSTPSTTTVKTSPTTTPTVTPTTTTSPCPTTTTPTVTPTTSPCPTTTSTGSVITTIHTSTTPTTTPCPTSTTTSITVTSSTPCSTTTHACPSTTSHHPQSTPDPQTMNPDPVSCDGVQPWQPNLAYTAGDKVIFNGRLFTAKQWSFNTQPGTSADAWTDNGECAQPVNNKANCAGVSAWQASQAYPTGSRVVFNGRLWVAVQWTTSNTPGDTSGTWRDLGACA